MEITAEEIKASIDRTYLKGDVAPYDLYIKMLMEYFSDRVLATDDNNPFDMPEGYTKYDYQMDAVMEGYQKLIKYDRFCVAGISKGMDITGQTCGLSILIKAFVVSWNVFILRIILL